MVILQLQVLYSTQLEPEQIRSDMLVILQLQVLYSAQLEPESPH